MSRVLLCALVSLLIAQAGFSQQPIYGDDPHALNQQALQAPPQAPSMRGEIQSLKAAVLQLQGRIDQLEPASGSKPGGPPSGSDVSLPASCQQLPGDPSLAPGVWMPPKVERDAAWPMNAAWKNGLQIESKDEQFRVHVGGSLQFDTGWNSASQAVQFGPGGIGELQDGAYFRRARIRVDGTLYQHFEWVAEFDFANNIENDTSTSTQQIGSPSFSDVWFAVNDLPYLGTVRVGWMKEPIGFNHLTSSRWRNFMETSPGTDSLGLHSPGVLLRNESEDERLTWAAGFFHTQNDNFGFGVGDGQYAETGRVTWLPWYEDEGSQLLHLGIGATHRHVDANAVTLHGRPSVRTMPGSIEPSLADTGSIGGTTQEVVDVELAGVLGPWTIQSEYYASFIHDAVFPNDPPSNGVAKGTLFYQGAYVEALYFLTGEYRAYNRKNAVFDRVIPRRNFNVWGEEDGWGAWQVGVRYGYLDLQDKGVNGATLNDVVLGLNWFLNPNMKVQWNLAFDHRDATPSGSNGWTYNFGARVALDF